MSFPWATDEPAAAPNRGGGGARAANSSMKNILYGDGPEPPSDNMTKGKKCVRAGPVDTGVPFATSAVTSPGAGRKDGYKKAGDTGDKFAVGAGKIGQEDFSQDVYRQNANTAAQTAQASRQRNIQGGGGIF